MMKTSYRTRGHAGVASWPLCSQTARLMMLSGTAKLSDGIESGRTALMKSAHTGAAIPPPVAPLKMVFFLSNPIQTPHVISGVKPMNQASA